MATCESCLYQGVKKDIEQKGSCVFCLVKGDWIQSTRKCETFKQDDPNLTAGLKSQLAFEIRQETNDNRRLRKIVRSTRWSMVLTLILAVLLFMAITKFYDKFLF